MSPPSSGGSQQAAPIIPLDEATDKRAVVRTAAVSVVMPYQVYNGRLQHPDPIVRQFGGFRGPAIYRLMSQENLALSADMSQWEDRVNKAEQRIRPGLKDDPESEQMARDAISAFRGLQNANTINLWILRSRWYGFTAIGVAGWRKDQRSGILAPFDLYNVDPWMFKFGPNFEPYLLTQFDLTQGVPVKNDDFFFPRWGSLFTAYGESDLRDVYLECWFRQNLRELMLASIEIGARSIPFITVPDAMEEKEFDTFERKIGKVFKYYVLYKSSNVNKPEVTMPNQGVIANGAAGKSENESMRYIDGIISRKILGTQQTQDKTGGSRALEDTRMSIAQDKTPPVLQFADQQWTSGYLNRISEANWPNKDRTLWPRMESINAPQPLLPATMIAVSNLANQLRLKEITPLYARRMLVRCGSFDVDEADEMVASIVDPKTGEVNGKLSTAPAGPSTALPSQTVNETHVYGAEPNAT
jgi:hypothetical protein